MKKSSLRGADSHNWLIEDIDYAVTTKSKEVQQYA